MPRKVNLSKILKQDTKKVFEQIANFENYSKYIPGCSSAQVLERNKNHEVGELKFDFLLRKYSITSKNILLHNKVMKTISIFILLIYWSIMIFAPVMSKDIKVSRAKISKIKVVEQDINN